MSVIVQEVITPDRAQELLTLNKDNRKVNWSEVRRLARDMENGNWGDSNDEILIDTEGYLHNGQHRLLAVIASGKTITNDVKYGFDDGNGTVDSLRRRTTADQMKMHGVDPQLCTKEAVALTNCYNSILHGNISSWTDSDKESFICDNAENIQRAINISQKGKNHPILRKAATEAAIFAALNAGVAEDKLYRFAECVNSGFYEGSKEKSAIVLRNYLSQPNPFGGSSIQNKQAAVTEQAIRDFVDGVSRRNSYPTDKHVYIIPKAKEDN